MSKSVFVRSKSVFVQTISALGSLFYPVRRKRDKKVTREVWKFQKRFVILHRFSRNRWQDAEFPVMLRGIKYNK